ncbi:hypothetical protein PIROE2DRAFT_1636 [Piromyces sp. E2]|nr:hypothetical protein PIROE2DRAFT_1636 [Piromyces sp. E2]|eukprot:OUM70225.1 hypothetical protein PIROE2DRAFT_1636 [Piromyces sp. E2]
MIFKRKTNSINDFEINNIQSSSEKNKPVCRICRDDDSFSELIVPCRCRGTVKYIHRECLDEWLKTVNKAVLPFGHTSLINAKCNLCNYKYQWEGGQKVIFILKYFFGVAFHFYTEQEFKYKAILDIPIEGMALLSSVIYTSPFSIPFTILEFIIYKSTNQVIPFTFMLTIRYMTIKAINECSTVLDTFKKYKKTIFLYYGKGIEFILRPFCVKLNGNEQVYSVLSSSFKIVIILLGIQYFISLWFNTLLIHFKIHSLLIQFLQKHELKIKEYTGEENEEKNLINENKNKKIDNNEDSENQKENNEINNSNNTNDISNDKKDKIE